MTTGEFIIALIGLVLGSSVLQVLFNNIHDKWKIKNDRKNKKEDEQENKNDVLKELQTETLTQEERLDNVELSVHYISEGIKSLLLDKILYLGAKYVERNYVSFDDRKRLRDMFLAYKNLKGNGDADIIMKAVDNIPFENKTDKENNKKV